jgi:hypothetical protein
VYVTGLVIRKSCVFILSETSMSIFLSDGENTFSEIPTTCPIMENINESHDEPGAPSANVGIPLSSSQTQLGKGTSKKKIV